MSDKTGGCAFPNGYEYSVNAEGNRVPFSPGMTLRDYFAGQALAGILAFPGAVDGNRDKSKATVALAAYTYADAMLAERSKP